MSGSHTRESQPFLDWMRWMLLLACFHLPLSRASAVVPSAPATTGPLQKDKADPFFESGGVTVIRLEIPESGLARLRQQPREYVKARVREGGVEYEEVAIHLKGAAGSFRGIDDPKPALTLNFDKFKKGQEFHGLDKLHLNNSVQDPSYLTELLCGDLFMGAGVPAARTTHAMVELNGRKLGLYVLKEGFNKTLLKRWFEKTGGNLYDGGFLKDIDQQLEKISGEEADGQPAIESLLRACRVEDRAKRLQEISRHLDMDRFLSLIAIEMMTWHWDGYLMKHNNYRVYHDPGSDRVVFLPHGMDQMFWSPNGSIHPNPEGLVAAQILSIPEGKSRYKARAAWVTTHLFRSELLTNRIQQVHARIRPALAAYDKDLAEQHDEAVRNLTRQIVLRAAYLDRMLGGEEPQLVTLKMGEEKPVKGWKPRLDAGKAEFPRTGDSSQPTLGVAAVELPPAGDPPVPQNCLASYRANLLLPPGRYAFLGNVRCEGLVPVGKSVRGSGAGLRTSMKRRQEGISGDQGWKEMRYEFQVEGEEEETELICDVRAVKGRAFFDASTLRVRRIPDAAPSAAPAK